MKIDPQHPLRGVAPAAPARPVEKAAPKERFPLASQEAFDRAEINRQAEADARALNGTKLIYEALPDVRRDKVDAARARLKSGFYDQSEVRAETARRLAQDPESHPIPPLTTEEVAGLRQRLASGYYDQPEVREQIAKGLIENAGKFEREA
ncbi:MAG: hypothetical protein FJY67_02730 [Calditrichaeota bacterium]|nr:hypothetical protein [Calditrichota bacterium]